MTATLHRPVCELLGCTIPIANAGMGGVARAELAAAVADAGGFGFLGMVREPVALIRSEVAALRARGITRFGVNVIPAATDPVLLDAQVAACLELAVPVIGLFWNLDAVLVQRLRAAGVVVVCQVGAVDEARAAEQAGAQALIVQGVEAGGHVRGTRPLLELLPEIVAVAEAPVLAAGGLADGADLATVMALGAQGGVFGTALMATHESFAHDHHKQRLVSARDGDTRLTEAFHLNWPRGAKVRVLANAVTEGRFGDPFTATRTVIGDEEGRPIYRFSTDSPLRSMTGDFESMALYAGEGVGRIHGIAGAADRVSRIAADAAALMQSGAARKPPRVQLASPVCYAEQFEDGAPARPELIATLNLLLEAERAGARVALLTARQTDADRQPLVRDIQTDEARWCAVLTHAIQRLDGTPSRATGAFFGKAMAIENLDQRLAFLNRGQAWVVKKLDALLPTVNDDQLGADLRRMLDAHQTNIKRVERALQTPES